MEYKFTVQHKATFQEFKNIIDKITDIYGFNCKTEMVYRFDSKFLTVDSDEESLLVIFRNDSYTISYKPKKEMDSMDELQYLITHPRIVEELYGEDNIQTVLTTSNGKEIIDETPVIFTDDFILWRKDESILHTSDINDIYYILKEDNDAL